MRFTNRIFKGRLAMTLAGKMRLGFAFLTTAGERLMTVDGNSFRVRG